MSTALYAEFTVLPGSSSIVAALVSDLAIAVRAEPGCLAFEPYTLASDPLRWFVYEVYADDAAFEAHLAADHGARFNAALAEHVEGGGSRLTRLVAGSRPDRPDAAG